MRSRIRQLVFLFLLVFFVTFVPLKAHAVDACPTGTFLEVFWNSVKTLHNIFPIKFAGFTVLNFYGHEDHDDSGAGILCVCNLPPPLFFRVGFPLHMWEPADIIETVQQPWCSPSVGIDLNVGINAQNIGDESDVTTQKDRTTSAQVHLVSYPIWWFMGLFLDFICLQGGTGFDYLYVTELDPLWQNDLWSSILTPEGNLFANKTLQLVCPVDAASSTIGFPIDYLFWCAGSWGSAYPFSKNMPSVGYLQANAGIASKFIAKMHRELILWLTSGHFMLRGWCTPFPYPVWKKTQYNLLLLYPVPNSNRQPIGRTAQLWGIGKNPPFEGSNFVWMLYRVRDCCAF